MGMHLSSGSQKVGTQSSPEEHSASLLQVGRAPQSSSAAIGAQACCPPTDKTPPQKGSSEQQIAIPMPLQHDSSAVQHESPQISPSQPPHTPPPHWPLRHWWLCLHFAPAGLLGLAQAVPG